MACRGGRREWKGGSPAARGGVFVGVLALAILPRTLEPLHGNRAGFRNAGLWLLEHMEPWDQVIDPYCWAHYYSGKVFLEGQEWHAPPGVSARTYVVLEEAGRDHPRLPLCDEARRLSAVGEEVYRWIGQRGKDRADVIVYVVPPSPGPTARSSRP